MERLDDEQANVYWSTWGRLWPWLIGFVVALLSGGLSTDLGPRGLLGLLLLPLISLFMWRRRVAVRVDSSGLTELLWPSGERHHWWTSVREIDERPRSLRLVTDDGVIYFGQMFFNRRAVAMAARRAKYGRATTELEPRQVADRLGAETVRLKAVAINRGIGRIFPWFLGGLLTIALIGVLIDFARGAPDAREALWSLGLGYPFIFAWLAIHGRGIQRQMVGEAVADIRGVELHTGVGRIFVPWADVGGAEIWAGNNTVYLATLAGDFQLQTFSPRAARRFVDAVDRVVAARDQGAELPRLEGASDAALSRAEDDNETALERGLSRGER